MSRISGQQDAKGHLKLLGGTVRARRKILGLSQESLAHAAGIDRAHMGKIERGERNLTFLNLVRIADALQAKPSDILDEIAL